MASIEEEKNCGNLHTMKYPKKTGFNLYQFAALCLSGKPGFKKSLCCYRLHPPPPGYENCSMGSLFLEKEKICFKSSIVDPLTLLTVISSNWIFSIDVLLQIWSMAELAVCKTPPPGSLPWPPTKGSPASVPWPPAAQQECVFFLFDDFYFIQ